MALDIIGWIKGWQLGRFFKELLKGKNSKEIDEAVKKAVELVNKIKAFTDSDIDVYTAIIPGNWDSRLVAKVKLVLPGVIAAMAQGQICASKPSLGEKLSCVITLLNQKKQDERTTLLNRLAADIARVLSDGKIDMSDAIILVEVVYRELFKKTKL